MSRFASIPSGPPSPRMRALRAAISGSLTDADQRANFEHQLQKLDARAAAGERLDEGDIARAQGLLDALNASGPGGAGYASTIASIAGRVEAERGAGVRVFAHDDAEATIERIAGQQESERLAAAKRVAATSAASAPRSAAPSFRPARTVSAAPVASVPAKPRLSVEERRRIAAEALAELAAEERAKKQAAISESWARAHAHARGEEVDDRPDPHGWRKVHAAIAARRSGQVEAEDDSRPDPHGWRAIHARVDERRSAARALHGWEKVIARVNARQGQG